MTNTIVLTDALGDNPAAAYNSLLQKLAAPGIRVLTFTAAETSAFYAIDGRKLSSSKTLRGIKAEMVDGSFNTSARQVLALDSGEPVGGAEYLAAAGELGRPLTILVRGGVDLGAASGCLDRVTLRNSVPREQRFEIHSRVAAAQILRRYRTGALHEPYTTIPPSIWWGELFGGTGDDLLHEARLVNTTRARNMAHRIDAFRGPLIAATGLIMFEVKARAPEMLDDVLDFLTYAIAGFCASDTPKDDPARVAHQILFKLSQEAKSDRFHNHLDAKAFLAVLVGWNRHAKGKRLSARDPELNPVRIEDGKSFPAPHVSVEVPKPSLKEIANA